MRRRLVLATTALMLAAIGVSTFFLPVYGSGSSTYPTVVTYTMSRVTTAHGTGIQVNRTVTANSALGYTVIPICCGTKDQVVTQLTFNPPAKVYCTISNRFYTASTLSAITFSGTCKDKGTGTYQITVTVYDYQGHVIGDPTGTVQL